MAKLLFLDVEATGIEDIDRLIQVAYRCGSVDRNLLFKPPVPIKLEAMAVHHTTESMVADKPPFKSSPTKDELGVLIAEGAILVAHNAKYDMGMLAKEGVIFPRFIDTLKIARHVDGGRFTNHQLQYLRYYYGVEIQATAHDAFGDILVLEHVFKHLYRDFVAKEAPASPQDGPMLDGIIAKMVDLSAQPTLMTHIRFGKYSEKPEPEQRISSIALRDRGYLEWLLGKKLEKPEGEEDWIYTLKHYLKQ